jgi:mannose/fructose-specific phosphotransferase system component IIA
MKGIVLISHGDMAKGMAQAATLFFGENIPQLTYCGLQPEDSPEEFAESLHKAIENVNSGDGVILLADLFGGTPCNQAVQQLGDRVDLISGMNFPLFLELLGERMGEEPDIAALIEKGQAGVMNVKNILAAAMSEDEDE